MVQLTLMAPASSRNVAIGKRHSFSKLTANSSVFRQYMNRKGGFNRPLDPIA